MKVTFAKLSEDFKECFPDDRFLYKSDGLTWIYAAPRGLTVNNAIHYELIRRGSLFFVEFHIEGNEYPNYVNRAHALFAEDENQRHFSFFTYYSSKYWQTRTPVFTREDMEEDITVLRAVVDRIIFETQNSTPAKDAVHDSPPLYGNHAVLSPRKVAHFLRDETIKIPDIQRGKVWNAARIGTLWDSMLRKFPIGTFSIQENPGIWELLDGQQRSYAISLGFDDFPDRERKKPILWLECSPEETHGKPGEKKFLFYVTTCSHPWGYRLVEDEMRNVPLTAAEKRRAASGAAGHPENAGKPYPDELYPYFSRMPIPVSLLTQWIDPAQKNQTQNWEAFREWCLNKAQGKNWRWLEKIGNEIPPKEYWENVCNAFSELEKYEIFLTSAADVGAEDIALYFTRIGRGGIVPSDEELAYSVLKSKIGSNFRIQIETVAANGMAAPSRIAHLAIRCFASGGHEFYSGSILEQANRIAREKSEQFAAFMEGFPTLVEKVDRVMQHFMHWHRSRYCSYAGGDLYLFLLLTARESESDLPIAVGAVEYIHCFANDVRRVLQLIRRWGIRRGFAEALKVNRYGTPILEFPVPPEEFPSDITMYEFENWWNDSQHQAAVNLLKRGYGNPKAYSMLLLICRDAISQNEYDPYLAEWSDESCPWDYDHILPRSWFDKIGRTEEAFFCNELKNSIGNLAPLPFSLNRSLSDDERQEYYPCSQDGEECRNIQQKLCIDRAMIGTEEFKLPAFGSSERIKFCLATLARFKEIYSRWFRTVGLREIFTQQEKSGRQELFEAVSRRVPDAKIFYADGGRQYPMNDELDWYRPCLAVGIDTGRDFIAAASDGASIEVGMRRRPENTDIDGKNLWWRDDLIIRHNFGEENLIEKLIDELQCLLQKTTGGENV